MIKLISKLFACAGVIFILAAICVITIGVQSYRFWFSDSEKELVEFVVEPGSGASTIAVDLEEAELIASDFWFKVYLRISGEGTGLKPGTFQIAPGMSYADIARVLQLSDDETATLTIPEGYTLAQIGETVMATLPNITAEDWDAATSATSPLMSEDILASAGMPDGHDLEGYLFPDTYEFFADATAEDVTLKLLATTESRYGQAISDTQIPEGWTMHDILTLASIVQREVRAPSEMQSVAGIFMKRLDIGMMLQADSTVNYITGKDTPAISLTDRDIDSPYNTYQYAGLPPGPISHPGYDAIYAVLHPEENPYYYFLTTPEGEVIYATTHDQHVENKYRYLR